MKRSITTILYGTGAALDVVGALLFVGNKTGLWPSFPFAGALTMTVGATLLLIGAAISEGKRAEPALSKKPASIVVTSFALLLFLPLNLGSWLWVGNNISEGKGMASTAIAIAVTGFLTMLVYLLIRNAVGWARSCPS